MLCRPDFAIAGPFKPGILLQDVQHIILSEALPEADGCPPPRGDCRGPILAATPRSVFTYTKYLHGGPQYMLARMMADQKSTVGRSTCRTASQGHIARVPSKLIVQGTYSFFHSRRKDPRTPPGKSTAELPEDDGRYMYCEMSATACSTDGSFSLIIPQSFAPLHYNPSGSTQSTLPT